MNLRYIVLIVIVALLSMIGLIYMQIKWMNEAYLQRKNNLDQTVYQLLSNSLDEYEKTSTLLFFKNSSVLKSAYKTQEELKSKTDESGHVALSYKLQDTTSEFYKELITELNIPKDFIKNMKPSDLSKLQKDYMSFNDRWKNQAKLMLFESICVDEKIIPDTIKSILKKNMIQRNLNFDYYICIVDASTQGIIFSDFPHLDKKILEESYVSKIFPNSIFNQYANLFLYIPGTKQQIYDQMLPMYITSFLFISLILVTFSMTIYTIYKQKRLSDMKTDFINNMTHELKTPVATIGLASNMIQKEKIIGNKEKVAHYASVIKQENERLLNNIEKVLQAARLKRTNIKLKVTEIDVNEVVSDIVKHNQMNVEEVGGKLSLLIDAECHHINGDKTHISNIVNNLIENSIKYRQDDVPLNIIVETKDVDKGINISVEDNGIGIPSSVLEKVFDKFYRVPTGNIHNVKGFGLGLNYVKEMTEAHLGNVSVSSELDKGSIFTIFFPFQFTGED